MKEFVRRCYFLTVFATGCGYVGLDADERIGESGPVSGVGNMGGQGDDGGKPASGGKQSKAGGTSSGGGTGGLDASGGGAATGGEHTGGAAATGGEAATGGAEATGGEAASGGAAATGGDTATGGGNACTERCDRIKTGLVAFYDFNEGAGQVAYDTSGVAPALNLSLPSNPASTDWTQTGLTLKNPTLLSSNVSATKVKNAVEESQELSVEAWLQPSDPDLDGPARVVTMGSGEKSANFLLGQHSEKYVARLRTSSTDEDGKPDIESDKFVVEKLTHVVFTHDELGVEHIYINGVNVVTEVREGTINNWSDSYKLGIGAEFNDDPDKRYWLGTVHLIAIYSRALLPSEVRTNFDDGP